MPARSTGLWTVVGVLLVCAAVPPLVVPLYDRTDPTLWGFPFYYWFQFALIPYAATLTVIAYYIAKTAFRRDREAQARRDGEAGS